MNTSLKTCFKCGAAKARTEFYKHSQMRDGLLGKCKECTKLDVRLHGQKPEVRARQKLYDQMREHRPERKAAKRRYQQARRKREPVKTRAHYALSNAIRDGKIVRQPCELCGELAQGHHLDYAHPLSVRWLCFAHHRAAHGQRVREEEPAYGM